MVVADVAYYQNQPEAGKYLPIDWAKMAYQGADAVWIKASQGLWPDRQFVRNWTESNLVIKRGPYHFFDPAKGPKEQADFFHGMITVTGLPWDKTPMVDLEWSTRLGAALKPNPAKYLEQVTDFLDRMEELNYPPLIIYCNYSHVQTFLPMPSVKYAREKYDKWARLGRHPLMIAQYHTDKTLTLSGPNVPRPWVDYQMWQVSADGNGLGAAYGVHSPSIDLSRVQNAWGVV